MRDQPSWSFWTGEKLNFSSVDYIKVLEDHLLSFGKSYYGGNVIF